MSAAQRNIIGSHIEVTKFKAVVVKLIAEVVELEAVAYALVEQIEGEAVASCGRQLVKAETHTFFWRTKLMTALVLEISIVVCILSP